MFTFYYNITYAELENNNLYTTLQQLSGNWCYDKELSTPDKYLTEEELIPLLDLQQEGDTVPYFKYVNQQLQKILDRENILELLDLDDNTKEDVTRRHSTQFSFDSRENSFVSYLIIDAMATSSAQVSYYCMAIIKYICI